MTATAAPQAAAVVTVPWCNAPTGLANADYMGLCPNYANTAPIRKFVDALPGLGAGGIPVATAKPSPVAGDPAGTAYYEIAAKEYHQKMNSDLPPTKLRGYVDLNGANPTTPTYMGPIIIARKDVPVRIKFSNLLPTGNLFLPVDRTYMGAGLGPDGANNYTDDRTVIHLHGGATPWISDGTPHQWITPANETSTIYRKGASFRNVPDMVPPIGNVIPAPADNDGLATYYYTNQQSGRLMFYHDHAYGTTRLNVYAGLAAGYLLTDGEDDRLINAGVIPGAPIAGNLYAYGTPLVIQDRTFVSGAPGNFTVIPPVQGTGTYATDPTWANVVSGSSPGDLWFPHVYMTNQNPADPSGANAMGRWDYGAWFWPPFTGQQYLDVPCPTATNPAQTCPGTPNPSGVPEGFMDTPIVNGVAYPFHTVEPKAYRFRILNAANDRFLNLQLYVADPLTILVTHGGSGYSVPAPLVTITPTGGDAPTIPAAATAVVSTGSVTDVQVTFGGSGYTLPAVSFNTNGGPGSGATGTVAMSGAGVITGVMLTSGGSGYTSAPTVVFTDTGGTPAQVALAVATITPAGAVASITVTNAGAGYVHAPSIGIAAPTAGTTATAVASVNTEVKMVDAFPHPGIDPPAGTLPACGSPESSPATLYLAGKTTGLPQSCWPAAWPTDGRDGGVPDPTTAGPAMIQIGTEGGFLPAPVVIPSTPVGYNYNRRDIVVLNIETHGLLMGPAERADVIVDFAAFAGKTLILYNDAPAPVPAFDSRIDYYTGDPDQTLTGGAPTTMPGYGPNTRTIMQLKVGTTVTTPAPFSLATLQTELPKSFKTLFAPGTKDSLIVPESAYNAAYGATYPDTYSRIQNTQLTFTPIGSAAGPVTMDMQPKAIQELFTIDYGRMNATLGVELPFTNFTNQTTILLGYIDPPTEVLNDGETQIWKVTHNGVDSHAMHFHLFNVQILNRVGWDGAIRPPDANELGWKETVRMNPLEDAIVALRPIHMTFPFGIDESNRLLDVTRPALSTGTQFANIDPLTNNPITTVNQPTNFGWEYVWHCHLLGHEENDMMRPIVFKVQPMAVAKNVKATATATPLKVTVTWTFTNNPLPADQATGLRIYKTVGTTSNLVATILNLATTSFVDTSVAYSTTYSYRIVAFSATGASLPSNIATVTTPAAPPVALTAPTLTAPAAAVTTNTVTLVWNTITGATKYQVWRAGATGAFSLVATPLAPGITYRVTGLTTLTTYRFYVVAANGNPAANSAPSNTVTVKTK